GNSAYDWNTMPRFLSAGGRAARSRESNLMVPAVTLSNPAIIRSVVVLPQPDGPSSEKNSPDSTSRSTEATAVTGPSTVSKTLVSPATSSFLSLICSLRSVHLQDQHAAVIGERGAARALGAGVSADLERVDRLDVGEVRLPIGHGDGPPW